MKILRFSVAGTVKYGVLDGDAIRGLCGSPFAESWNIESADYDETSYPLKKVHLLAPCMPSKYVGIGINHVTMVKAKGMATPMVPILFMKPQTSVIGSGEDVLIPTDPDSEIMFEGELLVVIGTKASNISSEEALDYVLGYSCTNDITDRAKMKLDGGNPTRAKSGDTFAPIGPCISTDVDPDNAHIVTWHNSDMVQNDTTAGLIFKVREQISYFSQIMTLMPGDVIATGTPAGNGIVKPGDTVRVEIDGIGVLENKFVAKKTLERSER